jgi:hypothetical protein
MPPTWVVVCGLLVRLESAIKNWIPAFAGVTTY